MALDQEQQRNAQTIFEVGTQMGLDGQTIGAAIATAMMESKLRNLDYGDRDSLGLFQQRPSQGWGTPEQIRDPRYSARKFFEAYLRSSGDTVLERIANTQRPAAQYRDDYANFFGVAEQELSRLSGQPAPRLTGARPTPTTAGNPSRGGLTPVAEATGSNPDKPPPVGGTGLSVVVNEDGSLGVEDDKLPPNATDQEITSWIQRNYPDVAGFLANDEIRKVLFDAAREDLGDRELGARLQQTEYWRTHGPSSRAFDLLISQDPNEAGRIVDTAKATVSDLLSRNGVQVEDGELGEIAKKAIREGWINLGGQVADANRMNDFTAWLTRTEGSPGGEVALDADTITALYRLYGIPISRQTAEDLALRVQEGSESLESIKGELQGKARGLWQNDPDVLRAIENGRTPADYFEGHRQIIADTLELNPEAVDVLNDRRWREVAQFWDGERRRSMTLREVTDWARDQEEFADTREYKSTEAELGLGLSRFVGATR